MQWGHWNKAVLNPLKQQASGIRRPASVNGDGRGVGGCAGGLKICARVEILRCERGAPPPPASRHIWGVGMVDRWACLFNGVGFLKYEFSQNIFLL